jgi:alanyl-tRNA synthetase
MGRLRLTTVGKTTTGQDVVNGHDCFRLVDTFGLPLEVIVNHLREEHDSVIDIVGYVEAALESKNFTYRTLLPRLEEVFKDKQFLVQLDQIAEKKGWKGVE